MGQAPITTVEDKSADVEDRNKKRHGPVPVGRRRAMVICADRKEGAKVRAALALEGPNEFEVEVAAPFQAALGLLGSTDYTAAVLSLDTLGMSAAAALAQVRDAADGIVVVVIGRQPANAIALETISAGAQEYLTYEEMRSGRLLLALRAAAVRQETVRALRKQVLELKASEARFRNLIVQSADGLVVLDKQAVVKFVNRAAAEIFGRPAADLIGGKLELPLTLGGTYEIDIVQEPYAGGAAPQDLQTANVAGRLYKVRSFRFVSLEVRVFETEWAGEQVYVATLREVTSRRRAEQDRLALASMGRTVSQDLDLQSVCERVADEVAKLVKYDRLEISLASPRAPEPRVRYVRGTGAHTVDEDRPSPAKPRHVLAAWIEVSFGTVAQPDGALGIGSLRAGAFTEYERDLLDRIAVEVYPALRNARDHELAMLATGASKTALASHVASETRTGSRGVSR